LTATEDPYRTPTSDLVAAQKVALDFRGLLFVPYAVLWLYGLSYLLALYASGSPPVILGSVKYFVVSVSCATLACALFVALRIRPCWLAALLTPPATVLLLVCWVLAERMITGGIAW
jgi:hypothetical protein